MKRFPLFFLAFLFSCSLLRKHDQPLLQRESLGFGTYKIYALLLQGEEKSCFQISLKSKGDELRASFKEWKLEGFMGEEAKAFNVAWTEESLEAKPQAQNSYAYFGQSLDYINVGLACADLLLPSKGTFTLKLTVSSVPWPSDPSVNLIWDLREEGPENKKAKPKERYRGW